MVFDDKQQLSFELLLQQLYYGVKSVLELERDQVIHDVYFLDQDIRRLKQGK